MGIFTATVLYKIQKIFSLKEVLDLVMKGMGGLIPMGLLMVFAFTMGATCKTMGTGPYVAASATATIHPALVTPLVFLVSCFISFATGTSRGHVCDYDTDCRSSGSKYGIEFANDGQCRDGRWCLWRP